MKNSVLVGREKEIDTLKSLLLSDESEFVSVIGRRRVGKTFLIQTVYADRIAFEITGIQNASLQEQLEGFAVALHLQSRSPLPIQKPTTWLAAFQLLIVYLESTQTPQKRVVFFDEMPWLATHRSGFLNAFGFFWNSWAVKNNIVVVICGSAASWMIQKVVHNKGGLYNRITKRLHLHPFTLHETSLYLQKRRVNFNHYQIAELYMAMGGIPHYLKEIQNGESVAQNIDRICFEHNGILYDEFRLLYSSLFDHSENHLEVVRALASKPSGMTRTEIINHSKLTNGGGLTKTLEELAYSGFVTDYTPFEHLKRETLYRLTDEYSLFYVKFIETLKKQGEGTWKSFAQTPVYRIWSGYAFENLCLKHISEIKKKLGISGIYSSVSSFYQKGKDGMDGCQIDLLINRNDQVINVFEIKWASSEYIITKSYSETLRKKISLFKYYTKTKKQVFFSILTTYGLLPNEHSRGLVDKELVLDDLFTAP
ncbi:MAG: ATP-binding protein [Spirosomaceae bacterium]|nr:ATP-binding protein [Spirosomataceae bacterium]